MAIEINREKDIFTEDKRNLAKQTLDFLLEELHHSRIKKDYKKMEILHPYIKTCLDDIKQSNNSDLVEIYLSKFQNEYK